MRERFLCKVTCRKVCLRNLSKPYLITNSIKNCDLLSFRLVFEFHVIFFKNTCKCERMCDCVRVCVWFLFICFFELTFTSTITLLMPASCYCMPSFNYGGKKARDVGLTCRCHLSNIMPDSIFYDRMFPVITCLFVYFWCFCLFVNLFVCLYVNLFVFSKGGNRCFPQTRENGCNGLSL